MPHELAGSAEPPDLAGLLRALDQGDVAYVLIGAVALAAHGPVRATADLDLVPDPAPENLRRLGNVLADLHARLASDEQVAFGADQRAALAQGRSLTLSTDLGGVDVVQRSAGVPAWSVLDVEAVEMELLGVCVRVCSRRHLREMKLARGTHRDLGDVEELDAMDSSQGL